MLVNGVEILVRGGIRTPPFSDQERADAVYEIAEALWVAKAYEPVIDSPDYDGDYPPITADDLTRSRKTSLHACAEVAEVLRRAFPELA